MPIIIYNVVPWTYLSPQLLARIIKSVPGVIGVKQSAGDMKLLADLLLLVGDDARIMTAVDALLYPSFILGAHGAIAAILTAVPGLCVQLWDAVQAGDHKQALALHGKLLPIWNAIFHDNLPANVKHCQALMGRPAGVPRAPDAGHVAGPGRGDPRGAPGRRGAPVGPPQHGITLSPHPSQGGHSMADLEESKESVSAATVDRRGFLKTAGAAAAVAGGIEGILAARRAPAFAQGTKLHWVRWVDFVPESDVELKRQMPEASKALGAEVVLETINANDLQPRITAAIQSGSGADIFMFQYNWAHLYQNAVVDVSDVAGEIGKAEGGFYDIYPPSMQVSGKWLAVPHSIVGNAVAYRKSWLKEVGATQYPKTWDEARKVFTALKKKGKPYGQTLGHTFGDAPGVHLHHALGLRRGRDRPERQEGRAQQQGRGRGGEVHAGVLEGGLRRGRARLGRHQQQPRVPRGRDQRDPERGQHLPGGQAAEGEDQGRQGRADVDRHRPRSAPGRARRAPTCSS